MSYALLRPAGPGPGEPAAGPDTAGWGPTRALGRAVLLVGLLLLGAVLFGRIDLVVLATPFAVGAALGLLRRPDALPTVRLTASAELLAEGRPAEVAVRVGHPGRVPLDLVVVRLAASRYLRLPHVDHAHVLDPAPGGTVDLPLRGVALRWGRPSVGPALAHGVAADGLLVSAPVLAEPHWLKVFPATSGFEAVDAMPRAAGLVGAHHSRRPGEGGELAGVRVFGPGDRLRRIDWRLSLRTGTPHVAATLSDRDAEVLLVLDVLHEAGRSGGIYGSPSVLDVTVRAAAGIAEHYLHQGDRVGLLEYGFRVRRLRPVGGRRQFLTTLEWLLGVDATAGGLEPPSYAFGAHLISANALTVVLTPLLDTRSVEMVAGLARSGRFVVAVDTMPADLRRPDAGPWGELADRLWRLDRENTIGLLREHGVPVVGWAGPGSLDLVLRQVARMAGAPRVALR